MIAAPDKGLVSVAARMGRAENWRQTMSIETTDPTNSEDKIAIHPPREGTKQAKLVGLLSRKSGVTLAKAAETLGWQRHTTSAAMTGLRKRGYQITRTARPDKDSLYRIEADEQSS